MPPSGTSSNASGSGSSNTQGVFRPVGEKHKQAGNKADHLRREKKDYKLTKRRNAKEEREEEREKQRKKEEEEKRLKEQKHEPLSAADLEIIDTTSDEERQERAAVRYAQWKSRRE